MNKENCALKLVDEIILYYDARSKKHQIIFIDCIVFLLELSPLPYIFARFYVITASLLKSTSVLACCAVPIGKYQRSEESECLVDREDKASFQTCVAIDKSTLR